MELEGRVHQDGRIAERQYPFTQSGIPDQCKCFVK